MNNYIISDEELKYRMNLSLQDKIDMSCDVIEKWHNHWDGLIYVAFSGGRDSTVLLDIVRNKALIPDAKTIPAVFNDTGLEFPEIKEFVYTIPNVIITRPKLTYRQVIEKYGFAVVSKEQSRFIWEARTTKSEKLLDIRLNGNRWGAGKISKKWLPLYRSDIKISHKCCEILKKNPAYQYERKSSRKAIIGSRVEESQLRKQTYKRYGCNMYDTKRPLSMPLSFWTKENILEYIQVYNIPYSSIYDVGYERTGCMWCLFGITSEKGENRIQRMHRTHPKIWNYCVNNMGIGDVLDFLEVAYE